MPHRLAASTEAVSPLVGGLLMVAIAMVLAVVVFLVANTGAGESKAPNIGLMAQEGADRILLARSDSGLRWDQFSIKVDQQGSNVLNYRLNAEAGLAARIPVGTSYATLPASALAGGDFLDLCGSNAAGTAGAPLDSVRIVIRHDASNTVILEAIQISVVPCA